MTGDVAAEIIANGLKGKHRGERSRLMAAYDVAMEFLGLASREEAAEECEHLIGDDDEMWQDLGGEG